MSSRLYLATVWLAAAAYAGPPLTTIQDVLYKADGTRFNGVLTISWNSFQAADNSSIVTQSTTAKVVDGNLRVQLVPSTTASPAGAYSVTYNSDGRIQFQERWAVPSSTQPLRVRDVRVAGSAGSSTGGAAPLTGPITQADVTGLLAELGARPVKGPTFAPGRVAMVSSAGLVESVSGAAGDCVRVDGTSGPCGSTTPAFVDGDAPSGIVDGANAVFTVAALPDPAGSLAVYRNGLLQKPGSDYTVVGRAIEFVQAAIPQPGDTLVASYRLGGTDATVPQIYSAPQVLCSGAGAATSAIWLTTVGTCSIPAGILQPGDRVDIRFDFEHTGAMGGFSAEIRWGSTPLLHRDATASDLVITGRADAGIVAGGARLSAQTWGAPLGLASSVASAPDAYSGGLTINFMGKVAAATDVVTLRNFTVVRLP